VREARKVMARVEKQLAKIEEREAKVHAQMAEQAGDHQRLRELHETLRAAAQERESLELEWLEAADVVG
jgi:predicted  nucleic acid-binding Zn-ribbon protein